MPDRLRGRLPPARALADESESTRRRGIFACIAATTTVAVTLGLSWPLLAIFLERQGVPTWLNGLSASVQMMAVMVIAPLAPRLIGRIGTIPVMAVGVAGMGICLLLLPVFPNVWAWFPIRFCLGLATDLAFTAGDIWINQMARDRTRGRLIGVQGMFLHAGFAVGPLAIAVLGSETWTTLYLGAAVVALALIPLALARGAAPMVGGKPRARVRYFLRIAPTLMLAAFMFGLIDSSVLALLPVYGIEKGLDPDTSALLLTMFVLGSVCGQVPIGWLADHVDRRRLLAACVFVTMLCIACLPPAMGHIVATWAVMLVMGVVVGSFFVIAMAMIGTRFKGTDLIGINASFIFLWGLGDVIGPAFSGGAMWAMGPDGMPLVGVVFSALFLAFVLHRIRTQGRTQNR